jgi:SAM-dependent methyltransferase
MRRFIKRLLARGSTAESEPFRSADYWDRRYDTGGNSGAGSYGRLARFKADTLNRFVAENDITTVVELGCGDGAQLALAQYPRYLGLDVSETAVEMCRARFAGDGTKRFAVIGEDEAGRHDLALSLDVIYHLIEDQVFDRYMSDLFASSTRYVAIYSSNEEKDGGATHVRHRRFTDWIDANRPEWRLVDHVPNPYPYERELPLETSFADFHFFARAE